MTSAAIRVAAAPGTGDCLLLTTVGLPVPVAAVVDLKADGSDWLRLLERILLLLCWLLLMSAAVAEVMGDLPAAAGDAADDG